jgi:hypothetical protein
LDKYASEERERQFKEKERIVTLNSKLTGEPGAEGKKPPGGANPKKQGEDNNLKTEEVRRFQKWMKNRDGEIEVEEFKSEILDEEEKLLVYKVFVDKRGGGIVQAPFTL